VTAVGIIYIVIYVVVPYRNYNGARGSVVVKALCYNMEGGGFDTI
jgi:hypothetical protein